MTHSDLIAEIDAFADAKNWSGATVTSRAVANSRLYSRLKSGGSCTLVIAERLRAYMADHSSSPSSDTPSSADVATIDPLPHNDVRTATASVKGDCSKGQGV